MSVPDEPMTATVPTALEQAHAILLQAFNSVALVRSLLDRSRADTSFGCGEALGALSKAKALVGRDIDDALARARAAEGETGSVG